MIRATYRTIASAALVISTGAALTACSTEEPLELSDAANLAASKCPDAVTGPQFERYLDIVKPAPGEDEDRWGRTGVANLFPQTWDKYNGGDPNDPNEAVRVLGEITCQHANAIRDTVSRGDFRVDNVESMDIPGDKLDPHLSAATWVAFYAGNVWIEDHESTDLDDPATPYFYQVPEILGVERGTPQAV